MMNAVHQVLALAWGWCLDMALTVSPDHALEKSLFYVHVHLPLEVGDSDIGNINFRWRIIQTHHEENLVKPQSPILNEILPIPTIFLHVSAQ